MRDLLIFGIVFGLLPAVLMHPWIGAMLWTWVSIMNPHRLTWSFAFDFPFAGVIAGATLLGFLFTKDERRLPVNAITVTLGFFIAWMCVTSIFAVHPDVIGPMFSRVMKIMFMLLVTMALVHNRKQVETFLWVIIASVGFYGVKGGYFTVRTGGGFRVEGPPDSFIAGNNEVGLACIMILPLMWYAFTVGKRWWVRWGMVGAMILTALAALGTQSRGALVAIAAMTVFLWAKNPSKLRNGVVLAIAGTAAIAFMPGSWVERMSTISQYETDVSALGRLNAWAMSWNLAVDRPIGGGFEVITPDMFRRYAPDPNDLHAAHSIYFQILGEHGFLGLFVFCTLWVLGWRLARRITKATREKPEMRWAGRLATMVQVSMVAYLVGGAFLSLAYLDLAYDLLVMLLALKQIVERDLAPATAVPGPRPAATPARVAPAPAAAAAPGRPANAPARSPQPVKRVVEKAGAATTSPAVRSLS